MVMFLRQLHWFHIKDNISLQVFFFFKSVNQYFPLMLKLGRHISQEMTNFEKVTKLECHTKKQKGAQAKDDSNGIADMAKQRI